MRLRVFITLVLVLAFSGVAMAETMSVVTKENAIRESCRFFAPVKLKVSYADQLEVTGKEGDWVKVKFKGTSGCIHTSALTDKKISLSGVKGERSSGAASDEVALAGKGFNPQVEDSYRKNHPELDFRKVTMIQEYRVPDEQLRKFIKNGGLREP